jgi:hypothetical protein
VTITTDDTTGVGTIEQELRQILNRTKDVRDKAVQDAIEEADNRADIALEKVVKFAVAESKKNIKKEGDKVERRAAIDLAESEKNMKKEYEHKNTKNGKFIYFNGIH